MSEQHPTIDTAVRILNEALQADPAAVATLFSIRIPCNDKLAAHPTVQVREQWVQGNGYFNTVSALGLINGILEAMTGQRVAAQYSDLGQSNDPGTNLEGFGVYPEELQNEEKKS
jgi:hypothetical protein